MGKEGMAGPVTRASLIHRAEQPESTQSIVPWGSPEDARRGQNHEWLCPDSAPSGWAASAPSLHLPPSRPHPSPVIPAACAEKKAERAGPALCSCCGPGKAPGYPAAEPGMLSSP